MNNFAGRALPPALVELEASETIVGLMQVHEFYSSLAIRNDNKIVVLLIDGLGGVSHKDYGYKTELEYASHPNLDRLASRGATGMLTPVLPGVTPGSGPAHLGLFGLDLFHVVDVKCSNAVATIGGLI